MNTVAITIALVGLLGIGAQWVAWRTGWPAIALMLVAGILAGPVLGIVQPHQAFGPALEPVISLAVAVILFEGGLSLDFRELRRTEGAVLRLALIGVPVGWALGAIACYYIAGLVWPVAILLGGILVVTGPTVVLPMLRQISLAPRPRAILKWEAIVNDPIGALCAVVTYEYLRHADQGGSIAGVAIALLGAAFVAGLVGLAVAFAIGWLLPRGHVPEYLKAPVLLVAVIGTFVVSNMIEGQTGLLAVTVMGVALANMKLASFRDFHPFKENITVILVSGVFVLLSANLNFAALQRFEWRFLGFVMALLFLVRPAAVFVSLAFSRVPWRERLFVAWIAPRGIVAVAISGLFALRLDELGYSDGSTLVTISFSLVVATVVCHGFSAGVVARFLGLTGGGRRSLLIVGSTSWSRSLAEQLGQMAVPIMLADTSLQRLRRPHQDGVPTFHGEILAEATEHHLDFSHFQALVAATDNEAYNALVCSEFVPELGRDAVYQLGGESNDELHALSGSLRGRSLFDTGTGIAELDERERDGWSFRKTRISEHFDFDALKSVLPDGADMLLLLRPNGVIRFFTHVSRPLPEAGDIVLSYAPPDPDAVDAKRAKRSRKAATMSLSDQGAA
ncbi:cation:proton antiporter [Sphingomonas abietis]|uniref:Sodium:proton antiporter n=1 Tax=Sphingomonas abietis TaxID=3012344 RepID=A0ABY7NN28_9SPHN|nr:sodium:proton antiporter [Sphingomonas abietis]WBO22929.1 sodium:proton antiporter [Sphingomonas abietis]